MTAQPPSSPPALWPTYPSGLSNLPPALHPPPPETQPPHLHLKHKPLPPRTHLHLHHSILPPCTHPHLNHPHPHLNHNPPNLLHLKHNLLPQPTPALHPPPPPPQHTPDRHSPPQPGWLGWSRGWWSRWQGVHPPALQQPRPAHWGLRKGGGGEFGEKNQAGTWVQAVGGVRGPN